MKVECSEHLKRLNSIVFSVCHHVAQKMSTHCFLFMYPSLVPASREGCYSQRVGSLYGWLVLCIIGIQIGALSLDIIIQM